MAFNLREFLDNQNKGSSNSKGSSVSKKDVEAMLRSFKEQQDLVELYTKAVRTNLSGADSDLKSIHMDLINLTKTLSKIGKGETVQPAEIREFQAKFGKLESKLDSYTGTHQNSGVTKSLRDQERLRIKEKKDITEANEVLFKKYGDKWSDIVANNSEKLSSASSNSLKIGLAAMLGPLSPLVNIYDTFFGVENTINKIFKRSEKTAEQQEDADKKVVDLNVAQVSEQAKTNKILTEGAKEDEKYNKQRDKNESNWRNLLSLKLGVMGTGFGKLTNTLKKKSGSLLDNMSPKVKGGIKGLLKGAAGILGMGLTADSFLDIKKKKGQSFFGTGEGESMMDSRATDYGKGIAGGALTGAMIGSFIPVVGTAIGAGVGALLGGLTVAFSDYQDEISKGFGKAGKAVSKFFSDTGVTSLVSDAFQGLIKGLKFVGDVVKEAWDYIDGSGILKSIGGVAGDLGKAAVRGLVDGIRGVASWISEAANVITPTLIAVGDVLGKARDWLVSKLSLLPDFLKTDKIKAFISDNRDKLADYAAGKTARAAISVKEIGKQVAETSKRVGASVAETSTGVSSAAARKIESTTEGTSIESVGKTTAKGVEATGRGVAAAASAAGTGVANVATGMSESVASGLGSLSAKFESGKSGSYAIGYDPKGGTSYGTYQIASNTGMMDRFLSFLDARGHKDWADTLRKSGPPNTGSKQGAFPDAWRALAKSGGSEFTKLQHDFIENTSYAPLVARLNKATGIDVSKRSKGLQDAIWSAAVQHGGAYDIILSGIQDAGGANASDADIIKAIYARRSAYTNKLASNAAARGDTTTASILSSQSTGRYKEELAGALATSTVPSPTTTTMMASATQATPSASVAATASQAKPIQIASATQTTPNTGQRVQSTSGVPTVNVDRPAESTNKTHPIGNKGGVSTPNMDSIPMYVTDEGLILMNSGMFA